MVRHRHFVMLTFTSDEIEDPKGGGHYHYLSGAGKTSTDMPGPKHTHSIENRTTSVAIYIDPDNAVDHPDDDLNGGVDKEDAKKRKKRKKKRKSSKKPKWGY